MKTFPRNEAELLELIQRTLPAPSKDVIKGIGDDCAVIQNPKTKGLLQLLKTDALVEGVHFASGTPGELIGWKALCRPLSDIAAMGGIPQNATITVAAPSSWRKSEWSSLYRGIGKAAKAFDFSVVGGETVRSPGPAFLSVTMTGNVPKKHLRLRSTAHPGDFLCVTGRLGGSFTSGRHLRFVPRLQEGEWLAGERGVTAMMDLSDGLGSDLPKLARSSNCSYRILTEGLPLHRGCTASQALSDGEDYELLLSITPRFWPDLQSRWEARFPKLPLSVIGTLLSPEATPTELSSGHDHFQS